MTKNLGEELDNDRKTQHPNPRRFPTLIIGFLKLEWNIQRRIIRQQRYLEVIQNHALGLFADYKNTIVADEDIPWLYKHNYILNPLAAHSCTNKKCTRCHPAPN
jgi:hypothetical protein